MTINISHEQIRQLLERAACNGADVNGLNPADAVQLVLAAAEATVAEAVAQRDAISNVFETMTTRRNQLERAHRLLRRATPPPSTAKEHYALIEEIADELGLDSLGRTG